MKCSGLCFAIEANTQGLSSPERVHTVNEVVWKRVVGHEFYQAFVYLAIEITVDVVGTFH